jgi:hypothetical protein
MTTGMMYLYVRVPWAVIMVLASCGVMAITDGKDISPTFAEEGGSSTNVKVTTVVSRSVLLGLTHEIKCLETNIAFVAVVPSNTQYQSGEANKFVP